MALDTVAVIAQELSLPPAGVTAVIRLLGEGATVPFIARYRKEATGGLDDLQIRNVQERAAYLGELASRRATILAEIEKQGKLTDALRRRIEGCMVKAELEDLYLPYRPKRRTRAMIARERGLQPLAERILAQPPSGAPSAEAGAFVDAEKGVPGVEEALQGARDIVAEVVAETAAVRAFARELYAREAVLRVTQRPGVAGPTKFETYYDFREPVGRLPSHRILAIRRGEAEEVLRVEVEVDPEATASGILRRAGHRPGTPFAAQLQEAVADATKRLVAPAMEAETRAQLKLRADEKAVEVFADNLQALLLAAPLGGLPVLAIDPGQRTGCKLAMVDGTGKLLAHETIYLVHGEEALRRARETLRGLVDRFQPAAIAVGNGTHGRETEAFAREVLSSREGPFTVLVNEAGASVYSASDVAREELPELDVSVRGAVSIARRLQDPLAELVKIEPKAIGVGQYQHDVHQPLLVRKLDDVVERCVNQVGVDLNTASAPLLSYVAGIGPQLAKKIVTHRDSVGGFPSRRRLLDVGGLGPRTFEQAAGFLRIRGGEQPLDASAVHPERYRLVERMARDLGVAVSALVGNDALVARIEWQRYVAEDLGEPTLHDILAELARPGRDPRASFEPPRFRDDVRTLEDLAPGMELEGVVTNVTAFGAFVDVGVHQDGLVHVSQLADRFVKDPHQVARPGQRLKVRVLSVDLVRRRISLSARSGEAPPAGGEGAARPRPGEHRPGEDDRHPRRDDRRPRRDDRRTAPKAAEPGPSSPGTFRHNPFADLRKK